MSGADFYALFRAKWNSTHPIESGCAITQEEAEAFCRTMLDALSEQFDAMQAGDRVVFYKFGSFTKVKRPSRAMYNVASGQQCVLPELDDISFSRSKSNKSSSQ